MSPAGKVKIGFYIAAIFAAGFVSGAYVSIQVGRHMMPGQADMAARYCADLQTKLNLTPDQMAKIRPIIDCGMDEFKNRLSTDMLSNMSNGFARISVVLTAEQKPKFEQIIREQQDMIRAALGCGTNTQLP